MKTVCVRNMPLVEEAFSTLGETAIFEGRTLSPDAVKDADLLAVRSTRKIDAELLEGSNVRFVGTATIGIDHLDTDYLESKGIHWCFAPGCNANSVSEYVTAALLCLANKHGFTLKGKTLGVIGVGNVGRRVVEKAEALGLRVLQNDPPRQRAEDPTDTFVSLDTLLAESDIVTTHVPMTKEGNDATFHMADQSFFAKLRPGTIFINAARGAVVKTNDLMAAINSKHLAHVVLDTWEGEPDFNPDLLNMVDLGSPHIAGHSYEGKVMGTIMVYQEACNFLGTPATWTADKLLPPPLVPSLTTDATGRSDEAVLWELISQVYDIEADDSRLRSQTDNRKTHFDSLRKNYPMRREFRFTTVCVHNAPESLLATLNNLGFILKTNT
jgi:erythronate-4-phosphate dehydrogenase